jgi:hypothetical protein
MKYMKDAITYVHCLTADNARRLTDAPPPEGDLGSERIVMLGKFDVTLDLYMDAEMLFQDIYPWLHEGVRYTPADLVGPEFWTSVSDLGRRMITHCLQHLAADDEAPLVDVTCSHCGTPLFQIIRDDNYPADTGEVPANQPNIDAPNLEATA